MVAPQTGIKFLTITKSKPPHLQGEERSINDRKLQTMWKTVSPRKKHEPIGKAVSEGRKRILRELRGDSLFDEQ